MIDPLVRERVRDLRQTRGWTQEELAGQAGVAPNTVVGLEGGRQTRWDRFEKIAGALGTTTHALQTGEGLSDVNPLVKKLKLSDEECRIARRFHDADTDTRLLVRRLLGGRRDPLVQFFERLDRLAARRRHSMLMHLAEQEKAQAEDAAAAKRKPKKP